MANRVIGGFNMSSNYEVSIKKPLDARSLVSDYEALLLKSNWVSSTNKPIAYNGMIVAVANTSDTSKNGLYFLFDPNCTSALKSPDVTIADNWIKIGETSEINDFVSRLNNIEQALSSFDSRLTALEQDKVIIRRDNEYNYKKRIEPIANNEICIVDVPGQGLRIKIGDGKSLFTDLPYLDETVLKNIDNLVVKGYFYQDAFYSDSLHTELLIAAVGRIYIDIFSSRLYTYNGLNYEPQKVSLPNATAEVAGIVKLYDTIGQNIDGTMTQRAITDELDDKFEMLVDRDDETLIFDRDLY